MDDYTLELRRRTIALLSQENQNRINPDGTITCHRCGKHLPMTEDHRLIKVRILWDHPKAGFCEYNDEERYGH